MATTTSKLGLPRPEASDNVSMANNQALIDAIDQNAASQEDLDNISPATIGAETPAGAQAKASTAESNAKGYADFVAGSKVSKAGDTMTGPLNFGGSGNYDVLNMLQNGSRQFYWRIFSSGLLRLYNGNDQVVAEFRDDLGLRISGILMSGGSEVITRAGGQAIGGNLDINGDFNVLGRIRINNGSQPYMDIQVRNGQYEFYPAGSNYGIPIAIGRASNRVDMPGGATIQGNEAWHSGNNSSSNNNNGYQLLASGIIIQWGSAQVLTGNTITFPIAFPNNVYQVVATALGGTGESLTNVNVAVDSSRTSFTAYHDFSQARRIRYMAVGN